MTRLLNRAAPYLLALPAWIWLGLFFVVPIVGLLWMSLMTGNIIVGFQQTFNVGIYPEVITTYWEHILRSLGYGLAATLLCIAIGYPVAYWIAFHGGAHKSTYLLLLLLPFFVTQVLRTISWKFLLADDGLILGTLKAIHLLPQDARVLSTSIAVIFGLAYTFLPFMVLPIYAVLEQVDHRVVEAAYDLYASRFHAFVHVIHRVLPIVFAGVLLVFVPSSADYVTAWVLGAQHHDRQRHPVAVLVNNAYPTAAAITFVLMSVRSSGSSATPSAGD